MIGKIVLILIIASATAYFATPHQTETVKPVAQGPIYIWDGAHYLLCYNSGMCTIIGGGGHAVEV